MKNRKKEDNFSFTLVVLFLNSWLQSPCYFISCRSPKRNTSTVCALFSNNYITIFKSKTW